jgi:nucleotide-binding universal stress UspA family protein
MIIRRIIAPTDISANSKTGIAYAISPAGAQRAELTILHVISPPTFEMAGLYKAQFSPQNREPVSVIHALC